MAPVTSTPWPGGAWHACVPPAPQVARLKFALKEAEAALVEARAGVAGAGGASEAAAQQLREAQRAAQRWVGWRGGPGWQKERLLLTEGSFCVLKACKDPSHILLFVQLVRPVPSIHTWQPVTLQKSSKSLFQALQSHC